MRFSDSGNEFSEENLVDVNLEIIKKKTTMVDFFVLFFTFTQTMSQFVAESPYYALLFS